MTTKDFIAPTSFLFKSGKDFMMGDTYGAASYLNILAPELTDHKKKGNPKPDPEATPTPKPKEDNAA